VTCTDGSTSCASGQCGTDLAGQCFFPEPVCPAPRSVPAVPPWLLVVTAGALGLLALIAIVRRGRRDALT
jgi:hypothetical protein